MSLLECPHCRYKNPSSEVYCRQCQRPMPSRGRPTDTVVTGPSPRHPPEKRVKIWFDDEGEPHETLVDPEPEASEPAPAPAPNAARSASTAQRRTHIWFDDEGEPHESPIEEAPDHTRVQPTPKQAWFDDAGLPHDSPQAAAAANRARKEERTQVSPAPQTHSAFTQQLTPKPIYFERVETARDLPLPRPSNGQTVLRPTPQGASARPADPSTRPTEPTPRPAAPAQARATSTATPAQSPGRPVAQPAQAAPVPQPLGGPRQAAPAPTPSARSSAGTLGTPVPQRAASPTAAATPTARGSTAQPQPRAAQPASAPGRQTPAFGADPNAIDDVTTDEHTVATNPHRDLDMPAERTVATPPPAQAQGAHATLAGPSQHRTVATSSSLASNYRAAAAHAALADGAASGRVGLQDRRNAAQPPLIGIESPMGPSAHTGVGPSRAVSTHTPFNDYPAERTVATPTPMPSTLASTLTPISGQASVAPHAPVVQRPTLTHTPVPMEDRSHQPIKQRTGGFFNRIPEPPAAAPSAASINRAEPTVVAAPSGGGFFNRVEPPAAAPTPGHGFFSRPTEPVQTQPQSRRITDPIVSAPTSAPTQNPFSQGGLEARVTTHRDAVHDQATVVRDSPFLQSEPTVVRSPVPPPPEEDLAGSMRRRLTEPMLARGPGFIAPATSQGIVTERAPLWRLAIAAGVDGLMATCVGMSTAAAEMLMFGGHWPTETTNPLDAFAMWMHNYPGTERRAVLMMLLFAWAYAALGARTGHTLGRTMMRLIAIGQDGDSITWPRAAWRSFVGIFSVMFFGAGYFWAIVDGQHRALHDIVSRSVVVTRKSA